LETKWAARAEEVTQTEVIATLIMKYEAEINGWQVSVELEQSGERIVARVGTRDYDLEFFCPEEGVYTCLAGDRVYEAHVSALDETSLRVQIGSRVFTTGIIDRKHRRSSVEHAIEGRQNLVAPMPGRVVRVLLRAGDEVALGQGVIVVEAMKMQNEIKSPKSGHVVEVRVVEGATVNANQILAVVE
jgi:biotin carboxyl carrier protein